MRDSYAVEGSVEQNPLHRELLEIARQARHDFLVDAALALLTLHPFLVHLDKLRPWGGMDLKRGAG